MRKLLTISLCALAVSSSFAAGLNAQRCSQGINLSAPGKTGAATCTWQAHQDADMQFKVFLPASVQNATLNVECNLTNPQKDTLEALVGKKAVNLGYLPSDPNTHAAAGQMAYSTLLGSHADILVYLDDDIIHSHDYYTPGDVVQCSASYSNPSQKKQS